MMSRFEVTDLNAIDWIKGKMRAACGVGDEEGSASTPCCRRFWLTRVDDRQHASLSAEYDKIVLSKVRPFPAGPIKTMEKPRQALHFSPKQRFVAIRRE
jgi:hypothetical protein